MHKYHGHIFDSIREMEARYQVEVGSRLPPRRIFRACQRSQDRQWYFDMGLQYTCQAHDGKLQEHLLFWAFQATFRDSPLIQAWVIHHWVMHWYWEGAILAMYRWDAMGHRLRPDRYHVCYCCCLLIPPWTLQEPPIQYSSYIWIPQQIHLNLNKV